LAHKGLPPFGNPKNPGIFEKRGGCPPRPFPNKTGFLGEFPGFKFGLSQTGIFWYGFSYKGIGKLKAWF